MTNQPEPTSEPRLFPTVSEAAKDITGAVAQEAGEVAELAGHQAQQLKDKLVDSGGQIRDWAVEEAEAVRRAALNEGRLAKSAVHRRLRTVERQMKRFHARAEDHIRKNPFEALLLALGAGFILGRPWGRQ